MIRQLFFFLCTAGLSFGAVSDSIIKNPSALPPGAQISIVYIPEMEQMTELDAWDAFTKDTTAPADTAVSAAWRNYAPLIRKQLTVQKVRGLSQWSKKQMELYKKVPPITTATFSPVRMNEKQNQLVYEATLDTLPSHDRIITRWLKAFVIYDKATQSINKIIITIRGQILE